jgi:hypothetical protein
MNIMTTGEGGAGGTTNASGGAGGSSTGGASGDMDARVDMPGSGGTTATGGTAGSGGMTGTGGDMGAGGSVVDAATDVPLVNMSCPPTINGMLDTTDSMRRLPMHSRETRLRLHLPGVEPARMLRRVLDDESAPEVATGTGTERLHDTSLRVGARVVDDQAKLTRAIRGGRE